MMPGDKPDWLPLDLPVVAAGSAAVLSLAHAMSRCTLQKERWLSSRKAVSTKWMTAFPAGAAYAQEFDVSTNWMTLLPGGAAQVCTHSMWMWTRAAAQGTGMLHAGEQAEHGESLVGYRTHGKLISQKPLAGGCKAQGLHEVPTCFDVGVNDCNIRSVERKARKQPGRRAIPASRNRIIIHGRSAPRQSLR
jgi:hypothetical protein